MARFKITGNSPFTGDGYGMEWQDGVAYTDNPEIVAYLKEKSYNVQEIEEETPAPTENVEAAGDPKPVHICPHCGKEYKTENGLAKHIRMDHPESPEALA